MTSNLLRLLSKNVQTSLRPLITDDSISLCSFIDILSVTDAKDNAVLSKKLPDYAEAEANANVIIHIKFSNSNTLVSVLTTSGKTLMSLSSGALGLKGKQKSNRQMAVKKIALALNYIKPDTSKLEPFTALHLVNVGTYRNFISKELSKNFLIISVKSFDLPPYNGCRKKKMRRKKLVVQLPK